MCPFVTVLWQSLFKFRQNQTEHHKFTHLTQYGLTLSEREWSEEWRSVLRLASSEEQVRRMVQKEVDLFLDSGTCIILTRKEASTYDVHT